MKRNQYKTIRIDPAPPTAEELAAKEMLIKQKQEATAKAAKQTRIEAAARTEAQAAVVASVPEQVEANAEAIVTAASTTPLA